MQPWAPHLSSVAALQRFPAAALHQCGATGTQKKTQSWKDAHISLKHFFQINSDVHYPDDLTPRHFWNDYRRKNIFLCPSFISLCPYCALQLSAHTCHTIGPDWVVTDAPSKVFIKLYFSDIHWTIFPQHKTFWMVTVLKCQFQRSSLCLHCLGAFTQTKRIDSESIRMCLTTDSLASLTDWSANSHSKQKHLERSQYCLVNISNFQLKKLGFLVLPLDWLAATQCLTSGSYW